MSEADLKNVYQCFTDSWRLFKKYSNIRQTDNARWEELVNESSEIAKTYGNCKLARGLLMETIGELERRSKEAKGNEAI